QKTKVIVLNPPSPDSSYINRDQMGGMGQKNNFGKDIKAKFLSKLKSNFIHLPVVQLVYAATLIYNGGFEVKVIDALNENMDVEMMLKAASGFNPDFLVLSVSSSCLLFERDVVVKKFKEIYPHIIVVTVGDTMTHATDQFKQPFDIAIVGEVERVIIDICGKRKNLSEIDGIIYFDKGNIVLRKEKEVLQSEDLNKLPFPRWELFPYKNYQYYPLLMDAPVATLQSTRGCPYGCGYCSYPVNQGLRWRSRSAEHIVDEIEHDIVTYGFKGIVFRDPLFTLSLKRIEEMCDLIKKRKLQFIFSFETRPELLTHAILDVLYEAGCRSINFGVEDIHPEILRMIGRKPIDQEKIIDIVHYAEKLGIRTTCFFIIGLPGSTKTSIQETIQFSRKLNPSHADYKIATPFPGTPLYTMAKMNKWIIEEGYDTLGGYSATMQINDALTPAYLEQVCNDAFTTFYLRPSYFFREVKKGNIFKKGYIVLKNIRRNTPHQHSL
ncbi:MAG: radical SAM protein, partial [Nanoarchaeota archaeon]